MFNHTCKKELQIWLLSFFVMLTPTMVLSRDYNCVEIVNYSAYCLTPEDTVARIQTIEEYDDDPGLDADESEALPLEEIDILVVDGEEVPAHIDYKIWSNTTVNPYKIRLVDKPDTTLIDLSGYCHPLTSNHTFNRHVTSEFGYRRGGHHYGIDLKLNTGDSVFCAFDGMVRIAMRGRAYGNYVVVRHYNGLETVYAHLSKISVKVNQVVKAGEMLGKGGSTGRSTGPHLHYELRYLGVPIPPRNLVDFDNYRAQSDTLLLSANDFEYVKELEKVRYWTVRSGDTLGRIAQRTGTSVARLCQLNNIKKTSIIRPGQRIRYT